MWRTLSSSTVRPIASTCAHPTCTRRCPQSARTRSLPQPSSWFPGFSAGLRRALLLPTWLDRRGCGAPYHIDHYQLLEKNQHVATLQDLLFAGIVVVGAAAAFGTACATCRVACEEGRERRGRFSAWKQHKIGRYENRLRIYSHPFKVFKYFSSIVLPDSTGQPVYYMTPQDFVRSLIPYDEIEGAAHVKGETSSGFETADAVMSGADPVDQNAKADGKLKARGDKINPSIESPELRKAVEFFKLADTDGDGLIAYPEYLFFLAILSIPERQFDIAFRIFDSNQNGDIDFAEFSKFLSATKPPTLAQIGRLETSSPAIKPGSNNSSNTGGLEAHSLIPTTPKSTAVSSTSLGVFHHLFGPNLDKRLSLDDFRRFMSDFRSHILSLEFFGSGFEVDRRDSSICARDFASIVVGYADYRQMEEYAERAKCLESVPDRVTFAEFKAFDQIMNKVDDIALAMKLYNQALMCDPKGFSPSDLSRAIKCVTDTSLSDTQLNVIYRIFDGNRDGYLDHEELLDVLKKRRSRGLDQPKDVGILRYLRNVFHCLKNPISDP